MAANLGGTPEAAPILQQAPNLQNLSQPAIVGDKKTETRYQCQVCLASFKTREEWELHMKQPAVPQQAPNKDNSSSSLEQQQNLQPKQQSDMREEKETAVRLRKFVQTHFGKTKSQANALITGGRVCVDGVVVTDTARLIKQSSSMMQQVSLLSTSTGTTENDQQRDTTSPSPTGQAVPAPLQQPNNNRIDVVDRWSIPSSVSSSRPSNGHLPSEDVVVVWKPVGLRTMGLFSENTLESRVSAQLLSAEQQERPQESANNQHDASTYHSWTRLDTGCGGLVLLGKGAGMVEPPHHWHFTYRFTLLVHGHPPDAWSSFATLSLPVECVRHWKKRKRQNVDEQAVGDAVRQQPNADSGKEPSAPSVLTAHVRVLEKTTDPRVPALSTLSVELDRTVSGIASLISHVLRQQRHQQTEEEQPSSLEDGNGGLRIVGDRFSRKEDAERLPRSMRNRIKSRLCMALTAVEVNKVGDCRDRSKSDNSTSNGSVSLQQDEEPEAFQCRQPIPDRWSASFWQTFLLNAEARPMAGT